MDDFAKAFSATWPFLVFGAVALGAVFMLLKSSISGLKTTLDSMRQQQEKLHASVAEIDRRFEATGQQHKALADRIERAEREFETQRLAANPRGADEDETVSCSAESLDRFNAAAEALSQVAKELEGFDSRQSENWLRIKGDLDEQAFALQRVQQHVDRLFTPPDHLATSQASAAAD